MKHLSDALIYGRLLTLSANIRPGWKGEPEVNTLAYFGPFVNYGRKKFYDLSPSVGVPKTFCKLLTIILTAILLMQERYLLLNQGTLTEGNARYS